MLVRVPLTLLVYWRTIKWWKNWGLMGFFVCLRYLAYSLSPQRHCCVVILSLGKGQKESAWTIAHSTHYYLISAIFFIGIPIGSLCGGERFMFMGKNYIHVKINIFYPTIARWQNELWHFTDQKGEIQLCNVVPLVELPKENSKHPNFEWRGQGRGADSFVQCLNNFVADCRLIFHSLLPPSSQIIHELGLKDNGNWESTWVKNFILLI